MGWVAKYDGCDESDNSWTTPVVAWALVETVTYELNDATFTDDCAEVVSLGGRSVIEASALVVHAEGWHIVPAAFGGFPGESSWDGLEHADDS